MTKKARTRTAVKAGSKKGRPPKVEGKAPMRVVNVEMPEWMVEALDRESERVGVPRTSLIRLFVDNQLRELERVRASQPKEGSE